VSSEYANAFEFRPHDFATRRISTFLIVPSVVLMVPGGLTLGFAWSF